MKSKLKKSSWRYLLFDAAKIRTDFPIGCHISFNHA